MQHANEIKEREKRENVTEMVIKIKIEIHNTVRSDTVVYHYHVQDGRNWNANKKKLKTECMLEVPFFV